MYPINSLSLAPEARAWLANSRRPRILHVFDHVCNLINERRQVLSVVNQQIGNGPFNLVIEDDVLFSDHLNIQSPISICANQLNLGELTIHIADTKLWSPRPDWETLHVRRDEILNQIMSLRATLNEAEGERHLHPVHPSGTSRAASLSGRDDLAHTCPGGRCQGVQVSNPRHREEIASSYSALLAKTLPQLPLTNYQSLISSLSSALANADISSTQTITSQLAGLGIGLTPAGDDIILGAVLAAWIIHPPEIASALAKEITNTAAPLTTSLSAAWLKSAEKGEAGILWHKFFDALISANPVQIQEAADRILTVGETSGGDALAGFVGVFMRWAELAHSKIP